MGRTSVVFSCSLLLKSGWAFWVCPLLFSQNKALKATQVNLYDHNLCCGTGTQCSPSPHHLVQPGRVCCHLLSGLGFSSRKTSMGRVSREHKSSHPEKYWGMQRDQDFSAHYEELLCPTQQLQVHPVENRWFSRQTLDKPPLAVRTRPGPPVPSVSYSHVPGTILSSMLRELPLLPGWQAKETST